MPEEIFDRPIASWRLDIEFDTVPHCSEAIVRKATLTLGSEFYNPGRVLTQRDRVEEILAILRNRLLGSIGEG